jgi:hypothetical protein
MKLNRELIFAAVLTTASACNGMDGGEDTGAGGDGAGGAGASGAGNGSGAGTTGPGGAGSACWESVDSVTVAAGQAATPHVVATESGFAITSVRGGEVWLDIVDPAGATVGSSQLSNAVAVEPRLPSVYPTSGGLVALWAEGGKVLARRAAATGQPQGSPAVVASTTSPEPRPMGAAFGDLVAATWMQSATSSTVALVDGSAVTESGSMSGKFPAVATRGDEVGIAWSAGPMEGLVNIATFDALTAPVKVPDTAALIKDIVGTEDAFFVAWEDLSSGVEQVPVVKLTDVIVASAQAAPSDSSANWPSMAWTGGLLAVAYYQFREGGPDVYVSFFDADLNPANEEILVATSAKFPSAAYGHDVVAIAYNVNDGPLQLSLVSCP